MTWYEKIRAGMELMKEGCAENHDENNCDNFCPFVQICLYSNSIARPVPGDWKITQK